MPLVVKKDQYSFDVFFGNPVPVSEISTTIMDSYIVVWTAVSAEGIASGVQEQLMKPAAFSAFP